MIVHTCCHWQSARARQKVLFKQVGISPLNVSGNLSTCRSRFCRPVELCFGTPRPNWKVTCSHASGNAVICSCAGNPIIVYRSFLVFFINHWVFVNMACVVQYNMFCLCVFLHPFLCPLAVEVELCYSFWWVILLVTVRFHWLKYMRFDRMEGVVGHTACWLWPHRWLSRILEARVMHRFGLLKCHLCPTQKNLFAWIQMKRFAVGKCIQACRHRLRMWS